MAILEDIFYELTHIAGITATVGSGVYYKNPVSDENLPDNYIVYSRKPSKRRDMVSDSNIFQVACFSKDTAILETITNAILLHFEDRRRLNGNEYYSMFIINQTDGEAKLETGHLYSILTFEFRKTT